jgi:phosphohistidine swiveling domain-containing protein
MAQPGMQLDAVPVPDDFPVEWEAPEDEQLSFMLSHDHLPNPISMLDFEFYRDAVEHAVALVAGLAEGPIRGWRLRRINTYVYQANLPVDVPEEEQSGRAERSEQTVRAAIDLLPGRWENETLPEVKRRLAWFDGFDLDGATTPALAEHLEECWRKGIELWDLHFMDILPAYLAISEFDELYRELFTDSDMLDSFKALQGLPSTTGEVAERLWALSRRALPHPDVRAALDHATSAEVVAALRESEAGRDFLAELDRFLDEYGKRTDSWVPSSTSWLEDPSIVLKNIRELAGRSEEEAPAIATERMREERERHLREVRARLDGYPEAVREQFESLLAAASAATVAHDGHNFWIDLSLAYRLRRVVCELGRRLAGVGVLDSPGDVFMLTRAELVETAERCPELDRRALAAERRAELRRFEGIKPPRALGSPRSPIAADGALGRFFAKFYGAPPAPSERPDVIQGLAGAHGTTRGVARVIRSLAEIDRLQPNEVLVTETTAPPWTPVFATAAAVVTDSGGILCHAAVVAREYGIPAVVGTTYATRAVTDGQLVEVDGSAGTVRIVDAPSV